MGGDGTNGAERVACRDGFLDEGEKASRWVAGNDIEGHQHVLGGADEVFVVGIEDAEIVFRAVVGCGGDFHKPERGEPRIDLLSIYRHNVEAGLRGDDGHFIARLNDQPFEDIESWYEQVLEVETLQIFERRGFPEVEAAGVLR